MRVEPIVSLAGQPFRMEIEVSHTGGAPVVELSSEMLVSTHDFARIRLHDDGTHGDAEPGDGVYTRDDLVHPVDATGIGVSGVTYISGLKAVDGERTDAWQHIKGAVRAIDTTVVGVPVIHELGGGMRATSDVVAMVVDDPRLDVIGTRFYQVFPDDRDLLVVLNTSFEVGKTYSGMAIHVRQDVRNIGAGVGVASELFGSAERLQMVVEMTRSLYASNVVSGYCVLTHELNHRWAAFIGTPLQMRTGPHWNIEAMARDSSAFGVQGECLMNDLELYLAGFLPADSVTAPLTADGYGIADVIAEYGMRRPDASTAQREFTIGFIVVADRPLEDHEMAHFHHVASQYTAPETDLGFNWVDATGGRSTLDSRLGPFTPRAARCIGGACPD